MQPGSWEVMGLQLMGQGAREFLQPALPGPGWLWRQPLVVREGPFVYEDKEEIEKFLRAEWGLASMTMVTACSSMQPLALGPLSH